MSSAHLMYRDVAVQRQNVLHVHIINLTSMVPLIHPVHDFHSCIGCQEDLLEIRRGGYHNTKANILPQETFDIFFIDLKANYEFPLRTVHVLERDRNYGQYVEEWSAVLAVINDLHLALLPLGNSVSQLR
jgi:hypothetical protein